MKKIFLSLLIVFGFAGFASAEWYDGGNLHQATMAEWSKATEANKLATCGDWVSGLYSRDLYNDNVMNAINTFGMPGIKEMANTCVEMLNSIAEEPDVATQKASELYVLGIALGGLLKN